MAAIEELELEAPSPGEPLMPHTHVENKQLLDEDIAARVKMMQGKLKPVQEAWLDWRWRRLWRKLNRAGYNDLVTECWNTRLEVEKLAEEFAAASADNKPAVRARGLEATKRGRELQSQLDRLKPLADEFASIGQRLETHRLVVEWEKEDAENRRAFQREANTFEQLIYAVFKQSPRLNHKGTDRRGREVLTIPRIEHKYIKEDKIFYKVALVRQGLFLRMLGRYKSALPDGVDIHDLSDDKTLENISGACDRKVTVERGKRGQGFFYVVSRLDSPDGLPRRVLYSKVMPYYPVDDHQKTPWPGGVTTDRTVVFFNFEDDPHILLAGATKGGKSNLINAIIATLARMNTPSELRMVLIDNKGGVEFTHWQDLPHLLMPMIKRADDVAPALEFVYSILAKRLATFERIRAKNLPDFNSKVLPEDHMPRVLVFVDEMATLMGKEDVQAALRDISSQGRAVGIHLILCTQHVINDVVHSTIKVNMVLRVAAQMPSDSASRVILDTGTAATLPKIAGRVVFRSGSIETVAQTPYISDGEIALAVAEAKKWPAANDREFTSDAPLKPREKFSRDDLIQYALEHLNGRLSAQDISKGVGSDVITDYRLKPMIAEIISEKEIEHRGQRYRYHKRARAHYLELIGDTSSENDEQSTAVVETTDHQNEQDAA